MKTSRVAFFPGSFDPVTNGHLDIITRASQIFDKIVVGVGVSSEKKGLFNTEEKLEILKADCSGLGNVELITYSDLTVNAAIKVGASVIIRGVRGTADLEYEMRMKDMNHCHAPRIDTVLFPTSREFSHVSSSLAKDVAKYKGDLTTLVTAATAKKLIAKFSK